MNHEKKEFTSENISNKRFNFLVEIKKGKKRNKIHWTNTSLIIWDGIQKQNIYSELDTV